MNQITYNINPITHIDQVTFPELYLRFNTPFAVFKIGGFGFPWQVLIVLVGIIAVLILASKSKENYYIKVKDVFEMGTLAFVTGFIGARLFYVLFKYQTYLEDPIKIMQLEYGYVELTGGMLIGIFVLRKLCKSFDLTRKDVFDFFAPFFALIQAIASFACMYNIRDFGITTNDGLFRMVCTVNGNSISTHPLFLYQAVLCLALFIITRLMQKKRLFQGQIFYTYLLLFSIGRLFIEGLRQDPMLFAGFNVGKIICILFIVDSVVFLVFNTIIKISNPNRNIQE